MNEGLKRLLKVLKIEPESEPRAIAEHLRNLYAKGWRGGNYDLVDYDLLPGGKIEIEIEDQSELNGIYTYRQFGGMVEREMKGANEMTNAIEKKETFTLEQTAQRQSLEIRIHAHIGAAAENLLAVGRCLNEAKDRGLVGHGEWENWVRTHTGMEARKAQRLMQAAREVPEGSLMERLPITKITTILQLPEGQREEMAERATAEDMTVRELQAAVERERRRGDQLMKKHNDVLAEKKTWVERCSSLQNKATEAEANARATIDDLKRQLRAATDVLNRRNDGISPKAQAEIDRLKDELAAAEAYAADQARLRQEAQQEALNGAMAERGEDPVSFGLSELAAATRIFLGSAGALPHMGYELSRLGAEERAGIKAQLDMMIDWADRCYNALNTYPAVFAEGC